MSVLPSARESGRRSKRQWPHRSRCGHSDKRQETVGALLRQSRFIAIAQAANRMTSRPTITALVSTARLVTPMTHDEITIQMPSRILMTSSHACGIDTAIAENTTIATPRIHAFHDAENSVPAKPSTHGDMNSHTPISRLSQSCQRFSFMTTPPVTKYQLDALRDSGFPLPDLIGHKNLA